MAKLAIQKIGALYQSGLSARQVGEKFGVTPWVVYEFMKKQGLPRRARGQTNKMQFEKSPRSFEIKRHLNEEEVEVLIAGIMLYWAEGAKGGEGVDFANSDEEMIKLFLRFLREIGNITEERLRVYLYCHADQNVKKLKKHWSDATRIPLSQFTKPYINNDTEKKNGREMKHGMIHIRYSDKRLLREIHDLTEQYVKRWVGTQAANGVTL
jgi:hypothetical protein